MLLSEASKKEGREDTMERHGFLESVKRFRIIEKWQQEQMYRKTEAPEKFSETENAYAKRDMDCREIRMYNHDRSF